MNKILTYDYEKTIRSCYAEVKSETEKDGLIEDAMEIMARGGMKFYKYEDEITGTLLGYGIYDQDKNSLKRFMREGK